VRLRVERGMGAGGALKGVKEQLRVRAAHGLGYGFLRYVRGDACLREKLAARRSAEVSFNYLGRFDLVGSAAVGFHPAAESTGSNRNGSQPRSHVLEVSGYVENGRLQMQWIYGSALHRRATITWLAEQFLTALQGLIAHCQSPQAGGFTPSDFPLARNLGQGQLDKILKRANVRE
jgi:non-ribosomal peptide synthase protein (TIGR01720 family)